MNIVHVLSQREVTGAEVYAATLANAFIEKGFTVHIVSDTFTTETTAKLHFQPISRRSLWYRINNIFWLISFFRKNEIHLVHAHSRAAAWCSRIAAFLTRRPLITTIHGRQSTFLSRRLLKFFGQSAISVCEEIHEQVFRDLGFEHSTVIRNPISLSSLSQEFDKQQKSTSNTKKIVFIGRLSNKKGAILQQALDITRQYFPDDDIIMVGGGTPEQFAELEKKGIRCTGHVANISDYILQADVVIGSGRVAVEALFLKKNVVALGEEELVGHVTMQNLQRCLATNFGDISLHDDGIQWDNYLPELKKAIDNQEINTDLHSVVINEYSAEKIVDRVNAIYWRTLTKFFHYSLPILMYHRVVRTPDEAGKHGIWITLADLESHLKYLQRKKIETCLTHDLKHPTFISQILISRTKKVMLTFDDGYEDNYTYLFPLLKKYNAKAVIFAVPECSSNLWDARHGDKEVPLMSHDMMREMAHSGLVEFGAHTVTHPHLTEIPLQNVSTEIFESKKTLEKILQQPVTSFAYPYGESNEPIRQLVKKAGFLFGFSSDSGPISLYEDLMNIRRIIIFPNTTYLKFARKVAGSYAFLQVKRSQKRK